MMPRQQFMGSSASKWFTLWQALLLYCNFAIRRVNQSVKERLK
jgi:hypothetical protein